MDEIQLGTTAKDKNSPLTGLVTGRAEYLNRAPMVQITTQDELGQDGKPIETWLEEGQVEAGG